jgi:UDP-2,3-diacylglucosamine hydrolase
MSDAAVDPMAESGPLAIICGAGSLPFAVADAVRKRGRSAVFFAIRGWADPQRILDYPHHWVALGQFDRFTRIARREGCRDVVLIGSLVRPAIWRLRPDLKTLRLLPRILRLFRGGDDHLLSGVAAILEEHGFRLIGAHEVAPEILMPEGALGRQRPNDRDQADIAKGFALLAATSPFDIGQGVVVADGHVLTVEAAEGTDLMLARIVDLRRNGRIAAASGRGVLVKAAKRGQDRRVDLPSIGPRTVEGAARAGLAGIAVAAGSTVVAEPELIATAADRERLFVVGMRDETARS